MQSAEPGLHIEKKNGFNKSKFVESIFPIVSAAIMYQSTGITLQVHEMYNLVERWPGFLKETTRLSPQTDHTISTPGRIMHKLLFLGF